MIEGMDLAGKGVILEGVKEYFIQQGKAIFDASAFEKREQRIPKKADFSNYGVIVSSEPTFTMVGRAIREEIIRGNSRDYSALSTAMAFSLDREILYSSLIIPALESNKLIIQDRGLPSSLVYQPVQGMDLKEVLGLPGNNLAFRYPPDVLIIITADPSVVIGRIEGREKCDEAIFENHDFQSQIKTRYESLWLKDMYQEAGTKVVYIDTTSIQPEETIRKALDVIKENIKN